MIALNLSERRYPVGTSAGVRLGENIRDFSRLGGEGMKAAAFLLMAATTAGAGQISFGNKPIDGKRADFVIVTGPSDLVVNYRKAQRDAFAPVDDAVVDQLSKLVVITLPWQIGDGIRNEVPQRVIFTRPGEREPVLEFPVEVRQVPLRNGFGAETSGYEGRIQIPYGQFRALERDMEFHLLYPGRTFSEKWKKGYFEKVSKPK